MSHFERLLTAMRAFAPDNAATAGNAGFRHQSSFTCALAKQCFINEYVFAITPEEDDQLSSAQSARSPTRLRRALQSIRCSLPRWRCTCRCMPLPSARGAARTRWTPAIDDLLNQQVRDPMRERELRDSIPRLTAIEDEVSQRVRQQYEENPYPRWVHAAGQVVPIPIDRYLREQFPTGAFTPLDKTEPLDMLVAGCGTGQIAIASAQKYLGARVLAIDLSLSSLCYAKRKTPADVAPRIEYAQADILKLASIDRSFDVIDSSGVLHHMADPFEGWRILLTLLRPGGLMHLGLYSEAGRRDVWAARTFIADRGFGSTPDEIRRCRQELLETPLGQCHAIHGFFHHQ